MSIRFRLLYNGELEKKKGKKKEEERSLHQAHSAPVVQGRGANLCALVSMKSSPTRGMQGSTALTRRALRKVPRDESLSLDGSLSLSHSLTHSPQAWLRTRGSASFGVFDAEAAASQFGVAESSYEPVPLEPEDVFQVCAQDLDLSHRVSWTLFRLFARGQPASLGRR